MWTLLLLSPVTFIRVSVICTVEPILLPPDHARTPWQLLHASPSFKFATKPSHRQLLPATTSPYGMEAALLHYIWPRKKLVVYASALIRYERCKMHVEYAFYTSHIL